MQDQFAEIIAYAKGIVRYKWVVIICAWVVSIAGWAYVYKMPDQYESMAKVHVDTRTMLRPLLRGLALQTDVRGLVAVMKKLMFTQQNMLKVAELAGMEGDYDTDKGRYAIASKLKSGLHISGGRGEIFSITYHAENPVMAQKVVQAVLTVFSEQAQQSTLNDVDSAQRFIEDQIREYEQRLRNAEKARENFKRANIGMLPGQGESLVNKMQTLKAELEKQKLMLVELSSRRKVLQEQLDEALESDDEWGLTGLSDDASEEESRIAALEQRKEELLFNYTEKHPLVVAIDARIKQLREKISEEAADGDEAPDLTAMSNPFVQSIKASINQVDAERASIKARIQNYEQELEAADEQFNTRLAIETEMQNLNRDYSTIRANYLKLVERKEQASMSEKVDDQASALKFKIADPANLPLKPSAPNRPLLYSAVFFAGIVIGVGIALVLTFIKPVFISTRSLRSVTGLPVLGSVSVFLTEKALRQRQLNNLAFYTIGFLLVIGYSGVMVSDLMS